MRQATVDRLKLEEQSLRRRILYYQFDIRAHGWVHLQVKVDRLRKQHSKIIDRLLKAGAFQFDKVVTNPYNTNEDV